MPERLRFQYDKLYLSKRGPKGDVYPPGRVDPEGNIVASVCDDLYTHKPVIDLDFPCRLIPSSTPGHFHLYIDEEMSWEACLQMLEGLLNAGLIQQGWYDGAVAAKRMTVRHPDFPKSKEEILLAEIPF